MAEHLSDIDIQNIVRTLDGWPQEKKLTWEMLRETLQRRFDLHHTRKALSAKVRIKEAFNFKKKSIQGIKTRKLPQSLSVAAKQIERLEAENSRLERENDLLLAQFKTWQHNAMVIHGMTAEQLNKAIPCNRKSRNIKE